MIELTYGNLLATDAEALVNTVNCVGYMGKGVALQFRKAWPDNYRAYQQQCRAGEVIPGRMFVYATGSSINPRFIINFPTKRHWRGKSRIEDIRSGLVALVSEVTSRGIQSIAIPALGCGNGGLDWTDIEPLIRAALASLPDVKVFLYPPQASPAASQQVVRTARPRMTPGRALLVKLMDQYSVLGESRTLLEVHKLAYFLQQSGENLRLQFQAAPYGPYAESLSKVLVDMEGHFTTGFDGTRRPDTEIELLPKAVEEADATLRDRPEAVRHLKRVSELIEGFESPYGMELLATTHWLLANPAGESRGDDVYEQIRRWSSRKSHLFQPAHVDAAIDRLTEQQWLVPGAASTAPQDASVASV